MSNILQKAFTRAVYVALLCVSGPAFAEQPVDVSMTSEKQVVIKASAESPNGYVDTYKYVPMEKVSPGEIVRYTINLKNNGNEPAADIVISNKVPADMIFIEQESKNMVVTYSIDKGESFNTPEKLIITNDQGQKRQARASEYTHVKWSRNVSLAAGGKDSLTYLAKLK